MRAVAAADRAGFAVIATDGFPATVPDGSPAAVDPRAATYGSRIPLRRRGNAETLADIETGGAPALSARARTVETPSATDPWGRLPAYRQRAGDTPEATLVTGRGCFGDCAHR
ncbi:hypothetical protein GCM10009557_31900 [Virgisporangium ochraceum]